MVIDLPRDGKQVHLYPGGGHPCLGKPRQGIAGDDLGVDQALIAAKMILFVSKTGMVALKLIKMTTKFNSSAVIAGSGIAFGTSGARGLVVDFTPEVCATTRAFVAVMQREFSFTHMALAIDNRPSSLGMAQKPVQRPYNRSASSRLLWRGADPGSGLQGDAG